MQVLTDAAHALMRDMAAGGREKQILCEPMWGTWSMSRFGMYGGNEFPPIICWGHWSDFDLN